MQIKDNDKIVGEITAGGKLEWDRKPGMMILSITPNFDLFFSGSPPLQINVEPGFEYRINIITQGFPPKGIFSLKSSKRYGEKETRIAYKKPLLPTKDVSFENIQEIPDFKAIPRKDDVAVLIGIENYQNITKSDFSKGDSGIIKDYLKALGFQDRNIDLLTDEKATFSSITKSLEAWLPNRVKKNSMVFIYYSGHGSPDPVSGDAYIAPYDVDLNYLTLTGYPLKRLYSKLEKLNVNEVIVVLDSCFSGAGGRSVLAKGARPLVVMMETEIIPQNMAILSATQGSQISTSSPEKGHGIFTYYFLKAIKDGKKTLAEIYEYIKPLVEDEAKMLNVQQSPSINPSINTLAGRFYLRN